MATKKEACAGSACFTNKGERKESGERTEIISPANEQYKGRKSLAAVPGRRAERAERLFQGPRSGERTEIISPANEQYKIARRAVPRRDPSGAQGG